MFKGRLLRINPSAQGLLNGYALLEVLDSYGYAIANISPNIDTNPIISYEQILELERILPLGEPKRRKQYDTSIYFKNSENLELYFINHLKSHSLQGTFRTGVGRFYMYGEEVSFFHALTMPYNESYFFNR